MAYYIPLGPLYCNISSMPYFNSLPISPEKKQGLKKFCGNIVELTRLSSIVEETTDGTREILLLQ